MYRDYPFGSVRFETKKTDEMIKIYNYIYGNPKWVDDEGNDCTDFISDAALSAMKNKQKIDLRYEHLVPKRQYLFDKINSYLSEGTEKDQFIEKVYQLLSDIYYVATITKKENDELDKRFKTDMPDGWKQGDNVKARYDEMKIRLNDTGLFEKE